MAESKTAVMAALLGNGALAIVKGASAVATGSAAMLAETLHSIADTGNQTLLFLGMRLARRPPDAAHPFGHGKNVYFWAFVVSVMLFTLGGAFSIWEAVRHYLHPVEKAASAWAYGTLAAGFAFESTSLGVAVHGLLRAKGDRSIRAYWDESRDPTLLTVLFEDSAALLSLVFAGSGLWLTERTGNGAWDATASALIGVTLLGVAVVLGVQNYSLLLGETAPPRVERSIREIARADPAVRGVTALHTMHLGPRSILIVLIVALAPELRTGQVEEAIGRLHGRIAEELGDLTDSRLVVIEPAQREGRTRGEAA
jgi:cation diffusion facilitator family transporter